MNMYILDENNKPVVCDDASEWARWFEGSEDRIVAQDSVGDVKISTVFLGLDHNFSGTGDPLLFETMVFGGVHDEYTERYTTYDLAKQRHDEVVAFVRRGINVEHD